MRAGVCRRAVRPARRGSPLAGERGYTLIEALVAIAIIGVVMASLGPFFVRSLSVTSEQRGRQAAMQLANDALERVRGLEGAALVAGRGAQAVTNQWSAAPAAVAPYLATMNPVWDTAAATTAGSAAPLPTQPVVVPVGTMPYTQHWYVGTCYVSAAVNTDLTCGRSVNDVPFRRVVVAVTWRDRACPAESCVYVAATLVSPANDPVFNANRPPPTVNDPPAQSGYRTVAISNLQVTANWGRLPLTWSGTGLPPGLAISTAGLITGTPTAVGTYPVTVTVVDRDGNTDDTAFTWTIAALPALTTPANQTTRAGTAVNLAVSATGGLGARTWSATGLPTGLTINPSTGVISGTPTTEESTSVTVTVTDTGGRSASGTFTWTVRTLAVQTPATQTTTIGSTIAGLQLVATGGRQPYTWEANNLPDGLVLDRNTGRITGQAETGTRYLTTVRVTEATGDTVSTRFVWLVQPSATSDMRISAPSPAAPDQDSQRGAATTLTISADQGSSNGYTWTATGLPPGLSLVNRLQKDATITGTPTTAGQYVVTLQVVHSNQKRATMMFIWTVRP